MAVADSNYRFVYVDIGSYGKDCDSTILSDLLYGHQFRQLCWIYPVRYNNRLCIARRHAECVL
jgi:hypothetical protein